MKITQTNDEMYSDVILAKLKSNNIAKCEWLRNNDLTVKHHNFMAFDKDELIGGAVGIIQYNWYFLEFLYVNEAYRQHKVGKLLMKEIEAFSIQQQLTGIRLETWDFQARGFYEKQGYVVWGELKDCPPGTTEFHLKKEL